MNALILDLRYSFRMLRKHSGLTAVAMLSMSLRARHGEVLSLLAEREMRVSLVGLAAALGFTRLPRGLIYGVTPTNLLIFAAVSVMLLVVALLACYFFSRRADRGTAANAICMAEQVNGRRGNGDLLFSNFNTPSPDPWLFPPLTGLSTKKYRHRQNLTPRNRL